MQKLSVPYLNDFVERASDIPAVFKNHSINYTEIKSVNWNAFPYCPETHFAIAFTDNSVLVHFKVKECTIRGFVTNDLGPVCTDSCVEFFACMGGDDVYYNIECNCLGFISMGARKNRNDKQHASNEILSQIKRWTSVGSEYIGERNENTFWECALIIPFSVFFKHSISSLNGKSIAANFYKCGGSNSSMHYVSWNPIATEKPDFHRPEFFGMLCFYN
ncbi:MAG: hypothetical protein MJ198_05725 [Bacteroidales bacterium]|nr:hypothetical protein [Bacteroidales bacterium]